MQQSAVPYGILMSIGSCWVLGFFIMITLAACMNPDPTHLLESPFGQPMAQIYYDSVGKKGALGLDDTFFSLYSGSWDFRLYVAFIYITSERL